MALVFTNTWFHVLGCIFIVFIPFVSTMGLCQFEERSPCSGGLGCGHNQSRPTHKVVYDVTSNGTATSKLISTTYTAVSEATPDGGAWSTLNSSNSKNAVYHQEISGNPVQESSTTAVDNQNFRQQTLQLALSTGKQSTIPLCPPSMVYNICSCQVSCQDPDGCNTSCNEQEFVCVCPFGYLLNGAECVPLEACNCFLEGRVVGNGTSRVNIDCSQKCTCNEDQLKCEEYQCNLNATCGEKNSVHQCFCNEGYFGDGETCVPVYRDCDHAYKDGHRNDGIYTISSTDWSAAPFNVPCIMSTNGGGWTVFQRRVNGDASFHQNWEAYKNGFGSREGDFWLGLDKIHYLVMHGNKKLRINMQTQDKSPIYAEYTSFQVHNETNDFKLISLGVYNGSAGDAMAEAIGRPFRTYDRDDVCKDFNCAQKHRGGWWFSDKWCNSSFVRDCVEFTHEGINTSCTMSNINGDNAGGFGENVFWDYYGHECYLNFTEMLIRP